MTGWIRGFFGKLSGQTENPMGDLAAAHSDVEKQEALKLKIRDDVIKLLNHAVQRQTFDVKEDFLQHIVPLLYRDIDTLTETDHIQLWDAYNKLSLWLAPVTAESVRVAEELNQKSRNYRLAKLLWVVGGILLIVVVVQIYSTIMSAGIAHFGELEVNYSKVLDNEKVTRQAAQDRRGNESEEPLRSIIALKHSLQQEMFLSAKSQCNLQLTDLGRFSFHPASNFCNNAMSCKKWIPDPPGANKPTETSTDPAAPNPCPKGSSEETLLSDVRLVIDNGKTINVVINSLILPLLLGVLGAAAFLSRRTLTQLGDSSLVRSWPGQYWLRLLLGGLLGVMGPLLYSSGNVDKIGLGLALFAFLLGYSVEVAFGLFDQLIGYVRAAIKSEPKSGKTQPVNAEDSADAARRQLAIIRSQLQEITALGPVLQKSLPADTFETKVKDRIETAVSLLASLGSELDNEEIDPAALVRKVAEAAAQCKELCGAQHPLAGVLGTVLDHFDSVLGVGAPGRSVAVVSSLFSGAAAAFKKGHDVYARWRAYFTSEADLVWPTPTFVPGPGQALECLSGTSIFKKAFTPASEALAAELMELAQSNKSTEKFAQDLWDGQSTLKAAPDKPLTNGFNDFHEFMDGWIEYRRQLIRLILQKRDFPKDEFPGADESTLPVSETLAAVDQLRLEDASKGDLDMLWGLSDALLKASQTNRALDSVGLIRRLLPYAKAANHTP